MSYLVNHQVSHVLPGESSGKSCLTWWIIR